MWGFTPPTVEERARQSLKMSKEENNRKRLEGGIQDDTSFSSGER